MRIAPAVCALAVFVTASGAQARVKPALVQLDRNVARSRRLASLFHPTEGEHMGTFALVTGQKAHFRTAGLALAALDQRRTADATLDRLVEDSERERTDLLREAGRDLFARWTIHSTYKALGSEVAALKQRIAERAEWVDGGIRFFWNEVARADAAPAAPLPGETDPQRRRRIMNTAARNTYPAGSLAPGAVEDFTDVDLPVR